jgi:hypothetical protein
MASNSNAVANPALTYTLDDFIAMKISDDMTYYNFSIIEKINGVEHLDTNLIELYIDELQSQCLTIELDQDQYSRYKYNPDLLAYDIYGSVQLDFVILLINNMYDPKEFINKTLKLPYASTLSTFLNSVYSKESEYIAQNRSDNNIII